MAVVSKQSFTRATKKSGPLVKVEISPGHVVKMYKEDAIAEGYLPPEIKAMPPAENKMMPRSENKAAGERGSGGAAPRPAGPRHPPRRGKRRKPCAG